MSAAIVYWEDIAAGAVIAGGAFAFDTASIKRFAAEFDPRPTHLDEAAASESLFKGLAASGAHTFAAWARLNLDLTPHWAQQAGAGIRDMRLLRPVRPGDVLSLTMTIIVKRTHPMRADFGFLDQRHEVRNQAGQPVLRMESTVMIQRRPG